MSALSSEFPVSSGEMPALDFDRADRVTRRHQLLKDYLKTRRYDAILLQDPANFAWLTCGGDNTRSGGSVPVAAILVTADARVILCNNVDSGQLFERELAGLGFLLKERPWTESPDVLRTAVCRGRTVASDVWFPATENIAADIQQFRFTLDEPDIERARQLSHEVAHAVEATARNFRSGATEAEVAGHLSHRLLKHGIEPTRLQVMADGQGWRYRHWAYGHDPIEMHCVISATGRRAGLHSSATRTVCLGCPAEDVFKTHQLAMLVQTTGMYFSQAGWTMEETWQRVARIYEKFDIPDEWRLTDQAEITGFRAIEARVTPSSQTRFQAGQLVHWHPSVRSAAVGDTILIKDSGFEVLTAPTEWPMVMIRVKDCQISRPDVLVVE